MYGYIYDNNLVLKEGSSEEYEYRFGTEPYLITSRKDSTSYDFNPDVGNSTIIGFNLSNFFKNNVYKDLINNYVYTKVNTINIYTKSSEVGLPYTTISAINKDNKNVQGFFDNNYSYAFDNKKSIGKYSWKFSYDSISSVYIEDYYKNCYSNRLITIETPNTELPLGIYKEETTGSLYTPDYNSYDRSCISSFTNNFYLDIDYDGDGSNIYIYNYSKEIWEPYKGKIDYIHDYIDDATSINGSYMLVKIVGNHVNIRYIGLKINYVAMNYKNNYPMQGFILGKAQLGKVRF